MRLALVSVAVVLWAEVTVCHLTCNHNSSWECVCTDCHHSIPNLNLSTVQVEFEECPSVEILDLEGLRRKVASWVREECGFVLDCSRPPWHLNTHNVYIAGLFCVDGLPSRVSITVLWNATAGVEDESNRLSANILKEVLIAREHLLTSFLHSVILDVAVDDDSRKLLTPPGWRLIGVVVLSSALCSLALCGTVALCVFLNLIGFGSFCKARFQSSTKSLNDLNELSRRNQQLQLKEWNDI